MKRICYQSVVDGAARGNYIAQLQKTPDEFSDEGFVFEVRGLSPPDTGLHSLTEFRCAAQTISNALQAMEAIDFQVNDFDSAFSDEARYKEIYDHFVNEIHSMEDTNLEVVIPAGGLPMLLLAREKSLIVDDVVVPNGIALVTKYTENDAEVV